MGFMQVPHSPRVSGAPRLGGLTPRAEFVDERLAAQQCAPCPGDIVRCERSSDRQWFYCRVECPLEDGDILCTIVEAQSWPDLVLEGLVPGRPYALGRDCVMSVVAAR